MFCIFSSEQNKYVRTGGKVIAFNSIEQATAFKQSFISYAVMRMLRENPFKVGEVLMTEGGMTIVELKTLNFKDEEIVLFENLKK